MTFCVLVALVGSACSQDETPGQVRTTPVNGVGTPGPADTPDPEDSGTPAATTTPAAQEAGGGSLTIAFGGDVHFEGSSAAALNGNLGSAVAQLRKADLAIVNLETAVTTRGKPEPKQYTFRAPAEAMQVLRAAGIDVVTVANNHGLDYGRTGLEDTLAASRRYRMPLIGAGVNAKAAYKPYRRTIRGVRVSVLAATDVLDSFALSTWPATATRSGLAASADSAALVGAVRAAAASSDVVVVDLHWGRELVSCPTTRQRELRRLLTQAGADVVVGSHAHVVGPNARRGRTAVHFGLGNFIFYAKGGQSARSGVYTVLVDRQGVKGAKWAPAVIRGGRPQLLTGRAATAAAAVDSRLARTCSMS